MTDYQEQVPYDTMDNHPVRWLVALGKPDQIESVVDYKWHETYAAALEDIKTRQDFISATDKTTQYEVLLFQLHSFHR